jgi:hypothetical protein
MGGYISTHLNSAPATEIKDASGNTAPSTTGTPNDTVLALPPALDEQQTTVEAKKDEPILDPIPPPPPSPVPIEGSHKSYEKTVTVDALPVQQNINIGGKNKKKAKKH